MSNSESNKGSYEGIEGHIRRSFFEHIHNPESHMNTYRGLRERSYTLPNGRKHINEGYVDLLPTLHNQNFIDLVNKKITSNKSSVNDDVLYEKPVILDLGYGKGTFLLDCIDEWGDDVEVVGIGTDVFTKIPSVIEYWEDKVSLEVPPTFDSLNSKGARLVDGNIIDLEKLTGKDAADFIVESNALLYVPYPAWEMMKKIYSTLRPDGVALLDSSPTITYQIGLIRDYLNTNGYDFDITSGVAFRKTLSDINLPIRTVNVGFSNSYPEIRR